MSLPPPARSVEECHAILRGEDSPLCVIEEVVNGIKMKTYKNLPPSIRAVWEASAVHADKTYVVYENERYTYKEAHLKVAALANQMKNEFGVKKGDRVAVITRNYPDWIWIFWATVCIGAISVPVNAWLTGPEMEYCITDSGSKLVFVDGERAERLELHFGTLKKAGVKQMVICRSQKTYGMPTLDSIIARGSAFTELPPVDIKMDDPATIFYTSGTTGKPKGALGSNRNYVTNLFNLMNGPFRSALRQGEPLPVPDPTLPQKCTLLSVPLFHATGCHSTLQAVTFGGSKLVLIYKWDPKSAMEIIQREKVNGIGGVPSMPWQILEHPDVEKYDLSSIESVGFGGAPSSRELQQNIKRKFKSAMAGNGYGLTETSSLAIGNQGYDYDLNPGSIGFATLVNDVKIVDENTGKEVPVGQSGEIWIKGPNVVLGYWNNPEATKKAITPDGYLKSGDIGHMDKNGYFYISDRAKDMLIRGGENIYSSEVENALYSHPAVMDCAVVPIPHKVLGEEVGAAVQLKPAYIGKVTQEDLQKHVRPLIAAFKVPIYIDLRTEPLERNANGKILKRDLKHEVADAYFKKTGLPKPKM
ncbi:hypothetical protein SmJEL517_g01067 [Synchytrium microbalum]|uniref:AMP-dependent synthetase/ligase domain-containing protein n=1 Tax=Synchytrium microbalum TaxID=1806994 RepID=A0A507CGC5_9FUNG|nr:uncharacterized protein SmJEL517_g01067 [Synchytrium microbalum]TPX37014.1 hypothetical protein SmJEL517_g01067 [Synchytrium microbalum]